LFAKFDPFGSLLWWSQCIGTIALQNCFGLSLSETLLRIGFVASKQLIERDFVVILSITIKIKNQRISISMTLRGSVGIGTVNDEDKAHAIVDLGGMDASEPSPVLHLSSVSTQYYQ